MIHRRRMRSSLEAFIVLASYLINRVPCQVLPPIGNEPSCKTCTTTPKVTTTIHPYFLCDSAEYYVQGKCKKYTTAYCAEINNIEDGLVPCGYSDAVVFKNIILLLGEERCNFYFSLASCLQKRIQSTMPICTSTEILFTLNKFIDDLASPIGLPHQSLYLMDDCEDAIILWKENTNHNTSALEDIIQEQIKGSKLEIAYRIESITFTNESKCVNEGLSYISGEMFRASDLCNRCVCNNGTVYCTNMNCSAVWLGEYCKTTSDCGVQYADCVNYKCQCEQHFFGVLVESTRICRKRGLYERCSSVEDCQGPNVECNNGQCLCVNNYIDVNNVCVFFTRYGDPCDNICYANYTECVSGTCLCIPGYFTAGNSTTCIRRPVEADELSQTTIVIIVVCSVTLFVLILVLAVLLRKIVYKNRVKRKGIKKKTLKNEDARDYVPTSLHVKPNLTSTFYNARLAKPYMMGHFDFDKVDTDA